MHRLPEIEKEYNIRLIEGHRDKYPRETKKWIMSCGHEYSASYRNILRRIERGETELLCKSCIHKMKNKKLGLDQAKQICKELDGELLSTEWINNKSKYSFYSNRCGHTWEARFDNTINVAKKRGYLLCPDCGLKAMNINKSKGEKEIASFIESLGFSPILNYRAKDAHFEIDVYIPEINFGIEYHGAYWHSEEVLKTKTKTNPRTYHKRKADEAEELGVDLLQVFDIEWKNKKNIIKDIIKSKLGKLEHRVGARECKIVVPNSKQANQFLEKNHIFGQLRGALFFGLEKDKKLLAVLGYRKEGNAINIVRYATELDYGIPGGFSKLLKVLKKEYPDKDIITYADRRFSQGNLYKATGFKKINISHPTYYYVKKSKKDELLNRRLFQRKYLRKKWDDFNQNYQRILPLN